MRNLIKSSIFLLAGAASFAVAHAGVDIEERPLVMPTYDIAPADLNPFFFTGRTYQGAAGHVYPYPMYDVLTDNKHDQTYNAVYLENDYTELCVMPELGGRILSAMDKATNYDFFYRQHVVKPALIGMLGAWMSGGVEWNIPHHHRASTQLPVDYTLVENDDGSATVWIGETELRHRMKWIIGLTIRPDRSYVEAHVRVFNNTPFIQSMLYWANVSVHCDENYQVIFPPKTQYGTQHAKNEFIEWPIGKSRYGGMDCNGMDMTMWKNYPKGCSIFAWNFDDDFLAGYDYGKDGGTIHVANHHMVGGKKFFLWGNCDSARMWRTMLTDNDGDYLELMVGAFSDNQPDYSWIAPGETREFKQYWYPAIKIRGVKEANLDAAVNLDRTAIDKIFFGFNATTEFEDAKVVVTDKGKVIYEETIDISPSKPYVKTLTVSPASKDEDFRVALYSEDNKELVAYQKEILPKMEKPKPVVPPTNPKDYKNVEDLYLAGLRIEQFHNATLNPLDYYNEALRRAPDDIRTNTVMGIRMAREGKYGEAKKYLQTAIDHATKNYTVAKDVEPIYYMAVVQHKTGQIKQAKDNYWKATWRPEFKVPSYFALAQIACSERKYKDALELIDSCIQFNSKNVKALVLKAYILRKLGCEDGAEKALELAMEIDKLDYFALAEQGFLDGKECALSKYEKQMGDRLQNILETATYYGNAGAYPEAISILQCYAKNADQSKLSPMVNYYIGYYKALNGDADAKDAYAAAAKAPTDYCFPFRAEEIDILNSAIKANPSDARAHYYLGNLYYFLEQKENGIKEWEKAVAIDPSLGIAWRNLGFAYNRAKDIKKAVAAYEKAVEVNPSDPRYYFELDKLYDITGKPAKERLALMEKNAEAVAKRDDAISRQIELYIIDGQYARALDILQKRHFRVWEGGGQIHGTFVDACLLGGLEKFAKKDYKGALADFRLGSTYPRNLEVGQPMHGGRLPQSLYFEALAQEKLGDKAAAEALFKKVVSYPDRGAGNYLNFYRAMAFKKLGDQVAASKLLDAMKAKAEKALKVEEKMDFFSKFGEQASKQKRDAQNHYLLGLVALANGEKLKAKSEFESAIKLDANHSWAKYYLGSI